MMENVIEVRNLKKSFGKVRAVKGISFSVKKGELFAFLGENGAGKSTSIAILCGVLEKDEGQILIGGRSPEEDGEEVKRRLGVVFQNSVLDGPLSVEDNLRSRGALYGMSGRALEERIKTLEEMFDLAPLMRRRLDRLSGGQRRRVDVARALLHDPQILILDEPTTGLDPQTRKMLWEVIDGLRKKEGLTVFLTTHYMEEAAQAGHVVILDEGSVVAEGSPLELKNRYTCDCIDLYSARPEDVKNLGYPVETIPSGVRIQVPDTLTAARLIRENPDLFRDFEVTKGKMDDVFLAVTGKKMKGEEK